MTYGQETNLPVKYDAWDGWKVYECDLCGGIQFMPPVDDLEHRALEEEWPLRDGEKRICRVCH